MDIAPLGFSVDTKPLADAQAQADATANSLGNLATAAERLANMTPGQQFGNLSDAIGKAAFTAGRFNKELELNVTLEKQRSYAIDRGAEAQLRAAAATDKVKQATDTQAASAKEAAKANTSLEKDMRLLSTTLDPTVKKMLRLGEAIAANERLFVAKKIGPEQYKKALDELWASMHRVQEEADRGPKAPGGGFFASVLRRASTGIPGFAAVGTQAVNAGIGGAALSGIAGLAAGGAVGLGAAMLIRELSQIPGQMAAAEDSFEALERRITGFRIGSFGEVEGIAERTGIKLEAAAKGMAEFNAQFVRFTSAAEQRQALFEAALAAGRLGGLEENERLQSAQQLAGIVESARVTPGQLQALAGSNPLLLQAAGRGVGGIENLRLQAATGQLTGREFAELIEQEQANLTQANQRLRKTAAELREESGREWDKVLAAFGGGLQRWWLQLQVDAARMFNGGGGRATDFNVAATASTGLSFGGVASGLGQAALGLITMNGGQVSSGFNTLMGARTFNTPQVSVPLGPAQADPLIEQLSRASTIGSQYGSYQSRQNQMKDDLTVLNEAIKAGSERWDDLDDSQRTALGRLKEYRRELQAAMRENDTPFGKLEKDVSMLAEAMGHGAGGLIGIWQQALQIQREQERMGRGAVASLESIIAKLKERAMLEAQIDLKNRGADLAIQQGYLDALTETGPTGDKLLLQATTEAQTIAFQKFGDGVKSNDTIVKQYIDTLYRLKLVQRDIADQTQADALQMQLADLQGVMAARERGATPFEIAQIQANQRRQRAIQERLTTAMSAIPEQTFTVPGTTAAGSPGQASVQSLTETIRWLESRGRDWAAAGQPLTSSAGALFSMQVMPSTAARPGYGITPARSRTPAEYNRVGEELVRELFDKYGGDPASVLGAYHSGPGNLGNLGPNGRAYVANGLARLGLTGGVGTQNQTVTIPGMPARPGGLSPQATAAIEAQYQLDIQNFRNESRGRVLGMEDQNRRARGIAFTDSGAEIDTGLLAAMRQNDELSIRASELELKVWEARRQAAPEDRDRAEQAVRAAEASSRVTAAAQIEGRQAAQAKDLREQAELLKFNGDELKRQTALYAMRNELIRNGIDPLSAEGQTILANTAALTEQILQYEKLAQLKDNARQTAEQIGDAFRNAMRSAAIDGSFHWKDAIRAIEMAFYDMLDRVMQQMVVSPLVNALTGILNMGLNALFGGLGGGGGAPTQGFIGPPSANGNVFGPDGLVPMANGHIVNTPTRMMFGNTRALTGEGPGLYEGILPLRRGPNGQLGVQMHGGGGGGSSTSVTIVDQRGAGAEAIEVQERETGDGMRQIDVLVRDSVKGHMRRGSFDTDNRAAFGINRQTTRR